MFRLGLAWREDGHSDSTSDSEELVTASVLISAVVLLAGKKKVWSLTAVTFQSEFLSHPALAIN